MRRDRDRGDAELLSAYVDGVAELSLDERRRIDDLLARDPALRADEAATRELIGKLRELPPVGGEPDWNALERSIGEAVSAVPRPWWQRLRWRSLGLPGVALAAVAAIVAVVVHDPAQPAPTPVVDAPPPAPAVAEPEDEPELAVLSVPLWLDGTDLEVALDAAELYDLDWELDEEALPPVTAELLPVSTLSWIDELEGEELELAEELLEQQPRRGPS